MSTDEFHICLQAHSAAFAKAVATNEGDWIIKGFIDIYRQIYTVSADTKIVSKGNRSQGDLAGVLVLV